MFILIQATVFIFRNYKFIWALPDPHLTTMWKILLLFMQLKTQMRFDNIERSLCSVARFDTRPMRLNKLKVSYDITTFISTTYLLKIPRFCFSVVINLLLATIQMWVHDVYYNKAQKVSSSTTLHSVVYVERRLYEPTVIFQEPGYTKFLLVLNLKFEAYRFLGGQDIFFQNIGTSHALILHGFTIFTIINPINIKLLNLVIFVNRNTYTISES